MSGIWPLDCSKLSTNPKNNKDTIIFRHDVIVKIFWVCSFSLVKFRSWSKFHVKITTGSGIMTIFFYQGLTRNSEIGNTHVWVLPNIWRLTRVMDTKFDINVSKRMLLNAVTERVTVFSVFELLRENQVREFVTFWLFGLESFWVSAS